MPLTAINFPSAIMLQSYRHYISIYIYIYHIVIGEDFAHTEKKKKKNGSQN